MLARYAIVGYSEDKTATHFAYIQTQMPPQTTVQKHFQQAAQ